MRVPKRSACSRNFCHQLRTLDALREARVVLDVAGDHQLAAGRVAADHDRLEVGPRRVDRGGQPGRPAADDDHVAVVAAAVGLRPVAAGFLGSEPLAMWRRAGAPSSTIEMLGKPSLVLSI